MKVIGAIPFGTLFPHQRKISFRLADMSGDLMQKKSDKGREIVTILLNHNTETYVLSKTKNIPTQTTTYDIPDSQCCNYFRGSRIWQSTWGKLHRTEHNICRLINKQHSVGIYFFPLLIYYSLFLFATVYWVRCVFVYISSSNLYIFAKHKSLCSARTVKEQRVLATGP